jgi:folate-binding protein YgfZ
MAGGVVVRADRGVIEVGGPEAAAFLHGLVTATVKSLAPGEASFGALLTPQGKILFDFFLTKTETGYLIEAARAGIADLLKRLTFYRLRAAVTLADRSTDFAVVYAFGDAAAPEGGLAFADPRLPGLATHVLLPAGAAPAATASMHDWHAHRVALGVPESGLDFPIGDTFPHDADMDDLGGVDFKKGCFIGQEVVSRMKHRGTARKRIVIARALEARPAWPDAGTEITCGEKTLGTLGSSADGLALALVRLDRAKEAIDMGDAIEVGGVTVALELPEFARFEWPEAAEG